MKKSIIASAVAMALAMPAANAAKVAGDLLEIYGKLHVSIDAPDTDNPAANDDPGYSSNSSRLGFKGKHKIGSSDMSIVYKIEQEVSLDNNGGSTFTTRNAYAGLKGGFGQIIGGHHDTPFKIVGGKWSVMGDTVAERRAVLGAESDGGNTMNRRGENAIMWSNKFGDVKAMAMYSFDSTDNNPGGPDDGDNAMMSVGVLYKSKGSPIYFGAAYEDWDDLNGRGATDGFRIMGGFKGKWGKVGLIYEDIDSDTAVLTRSVYGVNGVFKLGKGLDIRGEVLIADDSDAGADTGATRIGLAMFKKLDKKTKIYAAYGQTDNDANARYQGVDGGHGDEVSTVNGGTPRAFSVGLVFKF